MTIDVRSPKNQVFPFVICSLGVKFRSVRNSISSGETLGEACFLIFVHPSQGGRDRVFFCVRSKSRIRIVWQLYHKKVNGIQCLQNVLHKTLKSVNIEASVNRIQCSLYVL